MCRLSDLHILELNFQSIFQRLPSKMKLPFYFIFSLLFSFWQHAKNELEYKIADTTKTEQFN